MFTSHSFRFSTVCRTKKFPQAQGIVGKAGCTHVQFQPLAAVSTRACLAQIDCYSATQFLYQNLLSMLMLGRCPEFKIRDAAQSCLPDADAL